MELVKESLGKVAVTVERSYWNKNKHYDRLTVVEVENEFRTYISRRPVPGNIDILDRDYWIPFSSLREEITEDYKAMRTLADSIRVWNSQLNAKINALNNKLDLFINSADWEHQDIESRLNIIDTLIEALANTWRTGRPSVTSEDFGLNSFDPYLNIPIWWDGEKWISSKGVDVTSYDVVDAKSNTLPSPQDTSVGYTVIKGGDIYYMADPASLDLGWRIIIPNEGATYLALNDGKVYQYGNGAWTVIADPFST